MEFALMELVIANLDKLKQIAVNIVFRVCEMFYNAVINVCFSHIKVHQMYFFLFIFFF